MTISTLQDSKSLSDLIKTCISEHYAGRFIQDNELIGSYAWVMLKDHTAKDEHTVKQDLAQEAREKGAHYVVSYKQVKIYDDWTASGIGIKPKE